jgi:hypothetical protein
VGYPRRKRVFSYVQGEKLLELNFLAQSFKRLERMTASHPLLKFKLENCRNLPFRGATLFYKALWAGRKSGAGEGVGSRDLVERRRQKSNQGRAINGACPGLCCLA